MASDMDKHDEVVCFIPKSMFDYLADKEGQIEGGFKIHAVDRVAGTVRIGVQLLKVVKLIQMEVGTVERFQIHESPEHELSLSHCVIQRGAQWKRERNQYIKRGR